MTQQALVELNLLDSDINDILEQSEEYKELISNIDTAIEEANELSVITANDVSTASHYIRNLKKVSKGVNDFRMTLTRPLEEKKKEIKAHLDKVIERIEAPVSTLEKEILDFQKKEREEAQRKAEAERKRREEEAIQQAIKLEEDRKKRMDVINRIKETAGEMKADIPGLTKYDIRLELLDMKSLPGDITEEEWSYILGDINALKMDEVEPAIVEEVERDERRISQMNSSGVHTRRTKTFEIIDESLIPREYLKVDEQKIRAERQKHDFEAPSVIPGVSFSFSESVV